MINRPIKIIEGFDIVGKDSFAEFIGLKVYRPEYSFVDTVLDRNKSWVIGQSLYDFFESLQVVPNFTLNRGIASSYVYAYLYGSKEDQDFISNTLIDWYNSLKTFTKYSCIIHVDHSSMVVASKLYDKCMKERALVEDLDKFNSFEDYWSHYLRADDLYKEAYDKLKVPVYRVYNTYIE